MRILLIGIALALSACAVHTVGANFDESRETMDKLKIGVTTPGDAEAMIGKAWKRTAVGKKLHLTWMYVRATAAGGAFSSASGESWSLTLEFGPRGDDGERRLLGCREAQNVDVPERLMIN